jgi:hypothetical protein
MDDFAPVGASSTLEDPAPEGQEQAVSVPELVQLYYDDNELYCKTFFPKTCRQESAPFHRRIDDALWAGRRKVAIKVFRDGAKTSRVRMFLSKRIAFAVSRTILYISKSEGTSTATLEWLKGQVERQTPWAVFWGIQKGDVWAADEAKFVNTVLGVTITVIAVGIHGQIRGLNFEDFRPDLIVCDDIEDEKTTNTTEQIKKHSDLLHGTIMRSLASPVDNPEAMIVIIQTPLDMEDAIETAFANAGPDRLSDWLCVEASCFEVNEDGSLRSSWPAKFPLEFLLGEKRAYIKINKLSVWLREMEVTVTSKEVCSFDGEWLKVLPVLPAGRWKTLVMFIDPASSDSEKADFQALTITGQMNGQAILIAYKLSKGADIEQSITDFFDAWDLMLTLSAGNAELKFGVEIVGYQRQLKRAIEKEMMKRQRYAYIEPVQDKRQKEDVINQAFTPVASMGQYYCLASHTEFISDFAKYPRVKKDDLIESAARGLDMLDLTGRQGAIVTGGVARIATPSVISRTAHRLISGRGRSLGRFSPEYQRKE